MKSSEEMVTWAVSVLWNRFGRERSTGAVVERNERLDDARALILSRGP